MSATELPANWILAGSDPENITVVLDDKTMHLTGSDTATTSEFGTAMQTISSRHYAGKSVRFTADIKSSSLAGWAGLGCALMGRTKR
jgi:HSP20 family molecular chaperone IbpA